VFKQEQWIKNKCRNCGNCRPFKCSPPKSGSFKRESPWQWKICSQWIGEDRVISNTIKLGGNMKSLVKRALFKKQFVQLRRKFKKVTTTWLQRKCKQCILGICRSIAVVLMATVNSMRKCKDLPRWAIVFVHLVQSSSTSPSSECDDEGIR
jgi:hypothetical protein